MDSEDMKLRTNVVWATCYLQYLICNIHKEAAGFIDLEILALSKLNANFWHLIVNPDIIHIE